MESKEEQVKKQQKEQTQTLQTAGLFAAMNVVLTPLWCAENGLSKGIALLANVALLYKFHEDGKQNNTSFFQPNPEPTMESIVNNIVEGGSSTYNQLSKK